MPNSTARQSESSELQLVSEDAASSAKTQKRGPTLRLRPEGKCQGPGCNNVVAEGLVGNRQKYYFCSKRCWYSEYVSRRQIGLCEYCDGPIMGIRDKSRNPRFCSRKHEAHFHNERLFAPTEPFRELLKEYLAVTDRYRKSTLGDVKLSLVHFFAFVVREEKITKLEDIRPSSVTRYIAHERARGLTCTNFIGRLSTFFEWLRAEERVNMTNPVVPRIHRQRNSPVQPRPYHLNDLSHMWKRVEASGDTVLLLALAIGEECGLRSGEVCNIRISDVNTEEQKIFVRLPTKNMRTRTVPYHEKVAKYLLLWLSERNPECPHDHLIHGKRSGAYLTSDLGGRFRRLLSNEPEPAGSFAFHRLRHTWATLLMNNGMALAILKELGGWESWNSMQRYIRVLPETVRQQYEETYAKIQQTQKSDTEEIVSLLDFAKKSAA
jgi:integrase/recombinase XerC